jgi:hypothetical protein
VYFLLNTLAFPTGERLWALKPDFHCGWEKKRELAFLSFALGAFAFFALFFLSAIALFFWIRARDRESAKKAPAPTFGSYLNLFACLCLSLFRYWC